MNRGNSNASKQDTRMGDAFMQQRRGTNNNNNNGRGGGGGGGGDGGGGDGSNNGGGSNGGRPPSFVEIQQEQQQQQHDRRPRSSHNSNSRGGGGGGGRRNNDHRDLPIEQGCICSLKDAFGFIYCADREEELFFHFSEVQNCHPADLEIDDEVEFRVGSARNEDKVRAFSLHRLDRGTIVWEVEEDPGHRSQGIVEKPVRVDRSGKVQSDGVIRLLIQEEGQEAAEKEGASAVVATGPRVRFTPNDYSPAEQSSPDAAKERSFRRNSSTLSSSSRSGGGGLRLGMNDLIEFTLVTSRRNQTKYARSIHLLQSDRERQRILKEEKMLENATLERGVVTSLKNDFGFLRSNKRREEVYFHYTNVELDESEEDDQELKIGQEVEFLVVTETGGPKDSKISARKVKFLPPGSVQFETIVARGVRGIVSRCPHPSDPGHSNGMRGTVRLVEGIQDIDDDGNERIVKEAALDAKDAPGGSFSLRDAVGLWIREGDTLLFDVAKESIDGALAVYPTKKQVGDDQEDAEKASVKLVSCSLAGRTEGVVSVLKDAFGFVHCAERPIDSYFRLYEVFPKDLHRDLLRGMGITTELELQPGSEVQFDLSIQRTAGGTSSRQTRKGGGPQETLKAQRVLLLPANTIVQTKIIASNVKGVVEKEDSKQSYAGTIELAEEITGMTLEERHPLVATLVKSMLEDTDGLKSSLVFPDVQSVKEDEIVMEVVDVLSGGALQCSHLPVAGPSKGRLCISWTDDNTTATTEESGVASNDTVEAPKEGSETGDAAVPGNQEMPSTKKNRKKKRKTKVVKSLRYDKHNLVKELLEEVPPGVGDQIVCDIVQPRRTGTIQLANVRIVERQDPTASTSIADANAQPMETGIGIISEVVAARQFGFVSLLDEHATKREIVFFHFKDVISNTAHDNEGKAKNLKQGIQKGDEARFSISVQKKGGKRTAVKVELVPRGTLDIPNKAAKGACHGLVLMEPSHSSLKDTPDRKSKGTGLSPMRAGVSPKRGAGVSPKRGGVGRFGNVDLDDVTARNVMKKQEGCILLTVDPTNMFGKPSNRSKEPVTSKESTDSDAMDAAILEKKQLDEAPNSAICTHIPFKQGAIAIHGVGSTSVADSAAHGPRRGDLVSFVKTKSGSVGARDLRVVTTGCANLVRGRLEKISVDLADAGLGTATFIAATEKEESYSIQLKEVVSCDISVLKDKETVEGLLHEGKIYGVCRTKDLFLESKLGVSHKERPKLNLTVRKGLGGKIMAQSMMAKGPDGTFGFVAGWTTRTSKHAN